MTLAPAISCAHKQLPLHTHFLFITVKPDPNVILCAQCFSILPITKVSVLIQCAQVLQCCLNACLQAGNNVTNLHLFQQRCPRRFLRQKAFTKSTDPGGTLMELHLYPIPDFHFDFDLLGEAPSWQTSAAEEIFHVATVPSPAQSPRGTLSCFHSKPPAPTPRCVTKHLW